MVFVFSFNVSTCSAGRKHVGNNIYKCNQTVKALCETLILDHVLPLACVFVWYSQRVIMSPLLCAVFRYLWFERSDS